MYRIVIVWQGEKLTRKLESNERVELVEVTEEIERQKLYCEPNSIYWCERSSPRPEQTSPAIWATIERVFLASAGVE